jgi:hypothetical protein
MHLDICPWLRFESQPRASVRIHRARRRTGVDNEPLLAVPRYPHLRYEVASARALEILAAGTGRKGKQQYRQQQEGD